MMTYTVQQLKKGEGLSSQRPMQVFSYDGGKTWKTAELSESVKGNPTDHYTIPAGGTWKDRQ